MKNKIYPFPQDMIAVAEKDITLESPKQIKALAYKAISYQKRQTFTNICCISLCPLFMVAISGFLGSLITRLINSSQTPVEYVYCSNVDNMNGFNIPVWNSSRVTELYPNTIVNDSNIAEYPRSTLGVVYHANWARVVFTDNRGPPGASGATFQRPCVFWFGEDYPLSPLYERFPNATGKFVRDATHLSQPRNGWAQALALGGPTFIQPATINIFNQYQERTWMIVDSVSSVSSALIGSKSKETPLSAAQFLALPNNGPIFSSPQTTAAGLLGTMPSRYYTQLNAVSDSGISAGSVDTVPWFNFTSGGSDAIDDYISGKLKEVILKIAALDKSGILTRNLTTTNQIFIKVAAILQDLPHAGLFFNEINHSSKQYSWNTHTGTDIRVSSSSNFPTAGRRLVLQQTLLDNAILRNSNITFLGRAQITQGFRILPSVTSNLVSLPFGGIIGAILYPFGISFLLPIFAIVLVQEKEQRILVMMKMNGMKTLPYVLSHYITFFILFTISAFIFIVSGVVSRLDLFIATDRGLLILLFFLWGNAMISLAFFFSTIFNKSRLALVVVFLIVLCSVIISLVVEQLFLETQAPTAFFIWPPFAFYRCLSLMNRASFTPALRPYTFKMVVPGDEIFSAMIALAIETPVILFLSYYLQGILPSEFGVTKPWNFPILAVMDYFNDSKKSRGEKEESDAIAIQIDANETKFEDQDVKDERNRVLNGNLSTEEFPLLMKNMRKVYAGRGGSGPKLAVKDVTFAVEKGVTFGLLGPNGAGKTTLISILTGLYETSSGEAKIAGYNVKAESDKVYQCIGICPQFDIQWDDLTVGEHLYFYARLKGVKGKDEKIAVQRALKSVSLSSFENRLTKGLSGGERRRLSIAMALLGKPSVVFLDEPTTGLDPEVRRLIWDIVNEARVGRTIVLTTHSMEEAEALCQRIGIMAKGTLRCHANPTRLKNLYGSGYKIFANYKDCDSQRVTSYLESLLPPGWKKGDSFETTCTYEFAPTKGILSSLFLKIEEGKQANGILDWGIGETSLEEVFLRLITEDDASAEY